MQWVGRGKLTFVSVASLITVYHFIIQTRSARVTFCGGYFPGNEGNYIEIEGQTGTFVIYSSVNYCLISFSRPIVPTHIAFGIHAWDYVSYWKRQGHACERKELALLLLSSSVFHLHLILNSVTRPTFFSKSILSANSNWDVLTTGTLYNNCQVKCCGLPCR